MIRLTSNHDPLAPSFLDAHGGYAWWYVDVVDADGNGAVLIWSFGLPFLPGWTSRARRGEAPACRDVPSLNVVLYERGVATFYLLQRLAPGDAAVSVDGRVWRFGGTTFERQVGPDPSTETLRIDLDVEVPTSTPLRGRIIVRGTRRIPGPDERPSDGRDHEWCPLLGGATGDVDVSFEGRSLRMRGDAYHDRNGSPTHIDGLGIARWTWGRVRLPGRTAIWYLLWPTSPEAPPRTLAVEIDDDGTTRTFEDVEMALSPARRDRWGMRSHDAIRLRIGGERWLDIRHGAMVDRGPFYLREQVHVIDAAGASATGWAEYVEPSRVDLARHRPLVRMRAHDTAGPNSFWLPLFAGPRESRVYRLLLRRPPQPPALPLAPDTPPRLQRAIRRLTRE